MNKFQYTLGWLAILGSISAVIAFSVSFLVGETEGAGYIIFRLIWMPFIFLWGIKQVREYRYEQQLLRTREVERQLHRGQVK